MFEMTFSASFSREVAGNSEDRLSSIEAELFIDCPERSGFHLCEVPDALLQRIAIRMFCEKRAHQQVFRKTVRRVQFDFELLKNRGAFPLDRLFREQRRGQEIAEKFPRQRELILRAVDRNADRSGSGGYREVDCVTVKNFIELFSEYFRHPAVRAAAMSLVVPRIVLPS